MLNPLPSTSAPFDPAIPGTSEQLWESVLDGARELILPQAEILVVSPHPDDETFGAGGLIRTATTRAHEVSVLSVTDGEAAFEHWQGLRGIRHREVKHAMQVLSPRPVIRKRLRLPDGQVASHQLSLYDAINRMASDTTLLVAPFELDGHPDHEATGAVCAEVARQRGLRLWRYPIWAWHHGRPEQFSNHTWGRFMLDPDTQRTKSLAIECFISQLKPEGRPAVVPPHVVSYFTRPYEAFLL